MDCSILATLIGLVVAVAFIVGFVVGARLPEKLLSRQGLGERKHRETIEAPGPEEPGDAAGPFPQY